MESRKAKLKVDRRKTGTGGTTFRATLPTKWVREIGLSEDNRNMVITFDKDNNRIIIEKDQ